LATDKQITTFLLTTDEQRHTRTFIAADMAARKSSRFANDNLSAFAVFSPIMLILLSCQNLLYVCASLCSSVVNYRRTTWV